MERRRWDTDETFTGIATGRAFAPDVERLVAHLSREGWVAQDPEAHLLPHLRRACEAPDSPWRLLDARLQDDGVYEVEVEFAAEPDAVGLPVRAALALLAPVAETSFSARQVDAGTIECITGMLDGDSPYASHGHLIRLHIHR